jgi:hypothetical protein
MTPKRPRDPNQLAKGRRPFERHASQCLLRASRSKRDEIAPLKCGVELAPELAPSGIGSL